LLIVVAPETGTATATAIPDGNCHVFDAVNHIELL